jgi:hypothetical protein
LATLQTSISRRIGEKSYLKHFLVIPSHIVVSRGWTKGTEIDFRPVGRSGLLLQPGSAKSNEQPKFEDFAEKIEKVLRDIPEGIPWAKVRELTGLPQSKPNAFWVKRMQEERGLVRLLDPKTSRFIWKMSTKKGLERWVGPTQTDRTNYTS